MQQIRVEPPTISPNLNSHLSFNSSRIIQKQKYRPLTINLKLASNPFLKDQEKYHFLIYKLNDYNRRVDKKEIEDEYEVMMYQRLYTIICDLPYIETKDDQIARLEQTVKWYAQQEKLIIQRKDQGYVRYQVNKEFRNGGQVEKRTAVVSQTMENDDIPSNIMAKQSMPYKKGWRTNHKQIDIPARRLSHYKRKLLNIAPFIQPKEEKKPPKILYPKMPRFDPKLDEPEEPAEQQNKEGQFGADGEVIVKQGEQKPPQGQENKEKQAEQQQQDLGGFGEQPAEPEQEQPPEEEGNDKLAPRIKSYTVEQQNLIKNKPMKAGYQFYRGQECETERRMEERYLSIYQNNIKQQKEETMMIKIAEQWAGAKGKIEKDRQKRLENAKFSSQYTFSAEEAPKLEMLNAQEQIKYGFSATMNLRNKPRHSEINLSEHHLPKIGQQNLYQKSIRKDRLKSLKNKYNKLLNLPEYQQRETAPSICQYSSRKRGLSQIIHNHSKSKERLIQLDDVLRIKQKLARGKIGVDIRSLSMGLCLPQQEQESIVNETTGEVLFPDSNLPSNPFMVETKKKKKKKK